MQGVKINAKAIAEGMYRLFDEDDRAVLAFGMIPKKWIDVLEKMLAEKAEGMARDECERMYGFRPDRDCAKADWKAQFVRECSHEVTLALYGVAPMLV